VSRLDLSQRPPAVVASLEELEEILEKGQLDPVLREIGILAAVRRSDVETARRLATARDAGLGDDMIKAIADEDWTDTCFDDRTKIAFRFAMMYEAGHGISSSVFDGLSAHLSDAEILELAAVCSHWGARARAAVGFEFTAED
jgi:alkylhydroperoxidase family enzyme